MKVALDLGHARGTDASRNGITERNVCAEVARLLRERLREAGHEADIIDFPDESNAADLRKTAKAVNTGGYELSVSLHCDCVKPTTACGAHVCYVSTNGKRLAKAIAKRLCPLMPGRAEQVKKRTNLYMLNATDCPAVLVEFGFLSNEGDRAKLTDAEVQAQMAEAVAEGILEYLAH